jgi:gas vesicle protein GvpL/GvpF
MIFVYGVAGKDFGVPEGQTGVGEPARPLRLFTHENLAAVVSDVDTPPNRREDLEAHVAAMNALAEAGTLVPMRFGTLMDDEAQVRDVLLAPHAGELADVLRSLDGCVQMTIKAIYDEDVPLREIVREHPELKAASDRLQGSHAGGRDAWIALGERVAAAVEQARADDEQRLADAVAAASEHVVVEPPGHERIAARMQILVRRDRREALDQAVHDFAEEQNGRMTIRYSGPIAPYSFSDFSLDTGAPAWA